MSTSAPAIDPNDPRLTEVPLRVFVPAQITTVYEKTLSALGCHEKAQRSADVSRAWEWYKSSEDNSDAWRVPLFTMMLRTDPWKAGDLAREQENTYHNFVDLVGAVFTVLSFRFLAKPFHLRTKEHQENQDTVRAIRETVSQFLPVSIDKLGAMEDKFGRYNRNLKVIYAGAVDAAMHTAIQSALPEGVILQHHVFNKSDFHAQFVRLLNPDLPAKEADRAAFEVFLTRLVQIQLHKISAKDRKRFAYDPTYTYANHLSSTATATLADGLAAPVRCEECKKTHRRRIPRSPMTGLYAKYVSVVVDLNTRLEDIHPAEWSPLPPPE